MIIQNSLLVQLAYYKREEENALRELAWAKHRLQQAQTGIQACEERLQEMQNPTPNAEEHGLEPTHSQMAQTIGGDEAGT